MSTPPVLDPVSETVLEASRVFVAIAARAAASVADEVSLPQYRLLMVLHTQGSHVMSALAQQLAILPSTATRVCDRLVDRKLVRRRYDKRDRRTISVELTRRGDELINDITRRRRAEIDAVLALIPAAERTQLAHCLRIFAAAAGEIVGGEPLAVITSAP